jgi:hypothetical protein
MSFQYTDKLMYLTLVWTFTHGDIMPKSMHEYNREY